MYNESTNACSNVMDGSLPGKCASMVFPYVSMQSSNPKVYAQSEGLENGTLFPGLNLPFHKEIQSRLNCSNTALCELMALDFAVVELGLYLDTHKEDQEAFKLYQKYVALYQEGKEKYEKLYGPLVRTSAAQGSSYSWLENPWPWDYSAGGAK